MRISVIVTSFNYAEFVAECIDSVLRQSHRPIEVIIIDDGSTDGTREILSTKYGTNALVTIVGKSNEGQLSAIRTALHYAKGDAVALIDADDIWDDNYLSAIVNVFKSVPSVDLVYSGLRKFGEEVGRMFHAETAQDRDDGITSCLVAMCTDRPWIGSPTSALCLRRDMAQRIFMLPTTFDLDWRVQADDVIVHGCSILGGHKYFLAKMHVSYRIHTSNNWYGRQTSTIRFAKNSMRTDRMIEWFKRAAYGSGRPTTALVRHEFRTHSSPGTALLMRYIRIACLCSSGSPYAKLNACLAMGGHFTRELLRRFPRRVRD